MRISSGTLPQVPPRASSPVDQALAARLRDLGERRHASHEALRLAVIEAIAAGVSVRVIADLAQVSTSTVQKWSKGQDR